jgi:hypothetical protein
MSNLGRTEWKERELRIFPGYYAPVRVMENGQRLAGGGRAALTVDQTRLATLGYEAELCLTDLGSTAEAVVAQKLSEKPFECVAIGAGIRTIPTYFLLFEKLVNVVHQSAPTARICFNTKPSDIAEAVQRWV